eukprot:scaffold371632_cov76-Cyclotella_meneghiniana.AAC.1
MKLSMLSIVSLFGFFLTRLQTGHALSVEGIENKVSCKLQTEAWNNNLRASLLRYQSHQAADVTQEIINTNKNLRFDTILDESVVYHDKDTTEQLKDG